MLRLLLGGARSGKSALAIAFGEADGGPACFVATAEGLDHELAQRIERHRDERPADWTTVEEPIALDSALASVPHAALAIVDCLTLWVANCLGAGLDEMRVEERARRFAEVAATRGRDVLVVSNEVGSGIVPADAPSRRYRDLLGRVNAIVAAAAGDARLVVAGRLLVLETPSAAACSPAGPQR